MLFRWSREIFCIERFRVLFDLGFTGGSCKQLPERQFGASDHVFPKFCTQRRDFFPVGSDARPIEQSSFYTVVLGCGLHDCQREWNHSHVPTIIHSTGQWHEYFCLVDRCAKRKYVLSIKNGRSLFCGGPRSLKKNLLPTLFRLGKMWLLKAAISKEGLRVVVGKHATGVSALYFPKRSDPLYKKRRSNYPHGGDRK